jgi:hypothetical protein
MDWNHGSFAPQKPATDPTACCKLCSEEPLCAASTFYQGECFLKSAKDVAKGLQKTTKAGIACVPMQ